MSNRLRAMLLGKVAVVAAAAALSACNSGESKHTGQSLASVNGADITVHQVNAELRGEQPQAGATPADQQKRALEHVIDRELLAAQAVQAKLDRDPAVMMAIERNKSQILAQAYLQSRLGAAARPSKAEVEDYVQKHPELFAQRKVYDLRFLALPTAAVNDDVTGLVEHAASLDALADTLAARKLPFERGQAFRTSADLPPQMVADIDAVTKRPVIILRNGPQTMLASLTYVKDAPVGAAEAAQQVEQALTNRKSMTIAQDEIARLRRTAKIEYAPGNAPGVPKEAKAAPVPASAPASNAKSALESGVSGLR